jgi:HSP20 family molecular chaperone IbpA
MANIAKRTTSPVDELVDWFETGFPLAWRPTSAPRIRVEDYVDGNVYVLRAEVPGIDPAKDVEIEVADGVLTISGERREEKKTKSRQEFQYGSFSRSVTLPQGADEDQVSATYTDGVLEVRVPMSKPVQKSRKIEVSSASAK